MGELIRRRGSVQETTEQWLVPSTSDNGGGTHVEFYNGDSRLALKTYANAGIQRTEWLAQKDGKMSAVFYNSTENAVNIGTLYAGSVYPAITSGSFGGVNHENAKIVVSDTTSYATGNVPAGGSLKVRNIAYKDGTFPCVWLPANLTCELYGDIDEYFLPSVSDYVFTGTNTQNKRVTFYSDDGATVLGYTGYYATVNLTDTFTKDRDLDVIVVNTGGNGRDGKGMGLFLPNDIEHAYYSTQFQDAIMASSFMRVPIHVPAGYQLGVVYPNMTILAIDKE